MRCPCEPQQRQRASQHARAVGVVARAALQVQASKDDVTIAPRRVQHTWFRQIKLVNGASHEQDGRGSAFARVAESFGDLASFDVL